MAKSILGGIVSADKTSFPSFNTRNSQQAPTPPVSAGTALPAPSLWAGISTLIPQIRTALDALMAALRGAPALPQATRATASAAREESDVEITDEAVEPNIGLTPAPVGTILLVDNADDDAMPPTKEIANPSRLNIIPTLTREMQPRIFVADRADRSALGGEPDLQRPGIYLGLWANKAYVGMGEKVGVRASSNDRLGGLHPARRIICIVDQHDRLTKAHALVIERLMAQMVQRSGERRLAHTMPVGAAVDPDGYNGDRLFVARACLALRAARLLFTRLPAAALLLPPTQAPVDAPLQEGTPIYAIGAGGLRAHLAECPGEWRLLRGSEIRAEVRASAYGPAQMGRSELLHDGGLLRTGEVLTLTQDLLFSSAWAAAHFVLGERPRSDVWKPIASSSETNQLRR